MLRLLPLVVCAAALIAADTGSPAVDLFETLTSALSSGNAVEFMGHFDPAMPGCDRLRADVTALLLRADVLASVDFLSEEGDQRHRNVQVDWFLQIRDKEQSGVLVRRRSTVKCRLERRGKKWKIVAMEPLTLFAM